MKAKPKVQSAVEPRYIQQLHLECGGVLVAVAKPQRVALACVKCDAVWEINSPIVGFGCEVPRDWMDGVVRDQIPAEARRGEARTEAKR